MVPLVKLFSLLHLQYGMVMILVIVLQQLCKVDKKIMYVEHFALKLLDNCLGTFIIFCLSIKPLLKENIAGRLFALIFLFAVDVLPEAQFSLLLSFSLTLIFQIFPITT